MTEIGALSRSDPSATPTTRWPKASTPSTGQSSSGGPNQGPWKSVEDVELATFGWVHWHNTDRLHGYLKDVPPLEFEVANAAQQADQQLVGVQ